MKSILIVIAGNIGTGKTTISRKLAEEYGAEIVNCDKLCDGLISNRNKVHKIISETKKYMKNERSIIIDGTNLTKRWRSRFFILANNYNYRVYGYGLGKGNEESLNRRIENNPEETPEFWRGIHEQNIEQYEELSIEEGFDKILN